MVDDEIALPFIFVTDGADPPPELAAFKSAHPDWVSFPATFIPHEQPVQESEALRTQPASQRTWEPPPRKKSIPPQPARTDLGAALRAFQRASVAHPDPVVAMRALRDSPEEFGDRPSGNRSAPASPSPGQSPPFAATPADGEAAWRPAPVPAAESRTLKAAPLPPQAVETEFGKDGLTKEVPFEAHIQLAATTTNPDYAARILGYDRNTFGDMIHDLKEFYRLSPSDNVIFHDNGDIYFGSRHLGNIHDFAP